MPEFVYLLCALTSTLCAALLWNSYRQNRTRLLLWCTLCFAGLAINNLLLLLDLVVVPDTDLRLLRSGSAVVALALLLYGLVWESR